GVDAPVDDGAGEGGAIEAGEKRNPRMPSEPSIEVNLEEMKPRTSAGSIESKPAASSDPLESAALRSRLQSEPGVIINFEDTPVPTPPAPTPPLATGTTAGPNDPLESPALKRRLQSEPAIPAVDDEVEVEE